MANDKAEFWTTEQVADHLGISVKDVYESRRRNEFPGSVGTNRGRRLLFRSDLIEAGPQEPKTTNDPVEAILWTAQGIEAKLAEILNVLKATVYVTPTNHEDTYRLIIRDPDGGIAWESKAGEEDD